MIVTVNGERRELPAGATVASVVELLAQDNRAPAAAPRGVAVALDNEVVPHGAWPSTPLSDGARVEVLAAIQGGSAS
jgi:sulfur carrier protein